MSKHWLEHIVKHRKLYVPAAVGALCLTLVLGIYLWSQEEASQDDESSVSVAVRVEMVEARTIKRQFITQSQLQPIREVTLKAPSQVHVQEVTVGWGAPVEEGDVLAHFDSELKQLRQKLERLEMKSRDIDYRVTLALANKNFISRKEFAQKKIEREAAKIRTRIAELEAANALKSPIKGVVAEIKMRTGDYVDESGDYYIKVVDPSTYKVLLHVPQSIAKKIEVEDSVRLFQESASDLRGPASTGSEAYGFINAVAPVVDPKTGSVNVEILIDDAPEEWIAGTYVQVEIPVDEVEDAVSAPVSAVLFEKGQPYVYKVVEQEDQLLAEKVSLQVGLSDGLFSEVQSGLKEFDQIVVEGQGNLNHQVPIEIIY